MPPIPRAKRRCKGSARAQAIGKRHVEHLAPDPPTHVVQRNPWLPAPFLPNQPGRPAKACEWKEGYLGEASRF